jgi:hypothetical protein
VTFGGPGSDWGNSVQQTSDGGYVIAGSTNSYGAGDYDVWLIKTDASGSRVWDKTFGGPGHDVGSSVQQTSDGGYIVAGTTLSDGASTLDVWLIKTDASGGRVWDRTFGGASDEAGYSVQHTPDGGYVVAGTTRSYGAGSSDFWLIRTDASGSELWDRTFGGADEDDGNSVQQMSDGGYIVAGRSRSSGEDEYDIWLVKTDGLGNRVWDDTFAGAGDDGTGSVQQTPDGGFIVAGWTDFRATGDYDVWLIKTDTAGNRVWDRTFGRSDRDYGESIQQTPDGGYVIAGRTESSETGDPDVWLIRTDASGNEVWNRIFGGPDADAGYSMCRTSDGGFAVTGWTRSFGVGQADVYLIKTDADGN